MGHRRKSLAAVPNAIVCGRRATCVEQLDEGGGSLWVSLDNDLLVKAIEAWLPHARRKGRLGNLLLLERPEHSRVTVLRNLFDRVTGDEPAFRFLPLEELLDVLSAPPGEAQDLIIGGATDLALEALVLVRGDLSTIVTPFSSFEPSVDLEPDFRRLGFTDSGQTVRLGKYESASDAILYRTDAHYRRRLNARRRAEDQGFGPSLRRIRKQLGLTQADFPGVTSKTIARIERGETTPRSRTRKAIEQRLGMSSEQIETY